MKSSQSNQKWGGFLTSLFFTLLLSALSCGPLRAEIVESDFEDHSARELEKTLQDFKAQQQMITGEIGDKAGSGMMTPQDLSNLLEKMKNNPDAAEQMAREFMNKNDLAKDQKTGPGSEGMSKEERRLRSMFALYKNVPKEELVKQFRETMAQTPYGKSAKAMFPWAPNFLASWIKDPKAPFDLVRLTSPSKRNWLITYGAINLLIMLFNWIWKRRLSRRGTGLGAQFRRFFSTWGVRAAIFYVMIWPYVGPSVKILINEARHYTKSV